MAFVFLVVGRAAIPWRSRTRRSTGSPYWSGRGGWLLSPDSNQMYASIWEAATMPRPEPMGIKELGGPVAVYEFTESARKRSTETGDWGFLIDWIAFFSINLGVINLLPIPVLDGGHIVMSTVEGIRRKNLAAKTRNVLNIIGAVLVLGIMVLAITSDVLRLTGI